MKTIDWYFDVISPFVYLQAEQLHRLPVTVELRCKPVLFAGLLNHWGNKGPVEIPAKRTFTYRHTHWLARKQGIAFRMPPAHPFNPLRALRLAIALDCRPEAVREILRFIWREGRSTDDPAAWTALTGRLGLVDADQRIAAPEVKDALRQNTEQAVAQGVFGVPTLVMDGELFWGFDATEMVLDYLADPELFKDAEMQRISALPATASRR